MTAVVLAHQGGWDEVLLVLAPIALFSVLLYVANRRAEHLPADDEEPRTGQLASHRHAGIVSACPGRWPGA